MWRHYRPISENDPFHQMGRASKYDVISSQWSISKNVPYHEIDKILKGNIKNFQQPISRDT